MFNIDTREYWNNNCQKLEELLKIVRTQTINISGDYINQIFTDSVGVDDKIVFNYFIRFNRANFAISEEFVSNRFKIPMAGMSKTKMKEINDYVK